MSANTPEPAPKPSAGPAIWDLVKADMDERDRIGTTKYGQRLTAGDGRNSLVDAYQESLDQSVYLRKAIEESKPVFTPEELEFLMEQVQTADFSPMYDSVFDKLYNLRFGAERSK